MCLCTFLYYIANMKLIFLVLLVAFCLTKGEVGEKDLSKILNLVGLRTDDKERIYRPCHIRDKNCIRKFFADNSPCTIAKGSAPDPLLLERSTVLLSFVNITVILNNMQTSGLNNAKVTEFYVNKDTGNVVFAFDVEGMSERSTRSAFRYLRNGKEPIVLTDYLTLTFNRITYTAVIPKVPHLQLHKADIHADIADSTPTLVIGPEAYNSTDPAVIRSYTALLATLPRALREALLTKTSIYTSLFIQNNICDFGQEIITV